MSEKVAVITAGANGLGRATALRFAQEGAKGIVIADMLEESGLETVKMVQNAGGKASNGLNNILDLVPKKHHQRTPLFVGNSKNIDDLILAIR